MAQAKSDSSLTVGQGDSQAFWPNCSMRKPPRYGKRREYIKRILDKLSYFKNKIDSYEVKHLTPKSMNENIQVLVRCDWFNWWKCYKSYDTIDYNSNLRCFEILLCE